MASTLRRSHDRKVTNAVSPNGKTSKIANAFGLPSGANFSCPGATSICERVCYAGKLEKIYSGVRNVLLHNWNILRVCSQGEMEHILGFMIADFRADCIAKDAQRKFRIHWDGDFFSEEYTLAWANVCRVNPDIQFWVYTRSFVPGANFARHLADIPNLTVYLSIDDDNREYAEDYAESFGFFRAELADTFADAFPSQRKSYNCPENDRRIPLISTKGSACIRCGVCVSGRGDVVFSIGKK